MNKFKHITISKKVDIPLKRAWEIWINPVHIKHWNNASEDWHTTDSDNDLRVGGEFKSRMEAVDGSTGFDFGGTYTEVVPYEKIAYIMDDGRTVSVTFEEQDNQTIIVETFDAETENPIEMQKHGWQAILDNYKKYAENLEK